MALSESFTQSLKSALRDGPSNIDVPDGSNQNEVISFLSANGLKVTSIDHYLDGKTNISFEK